MMIQQDWFMTPITLAEHIAWREAPPVCQKGFGQQPWEEDSEGLSKDSGDFQPLKPSLRRQMLSTPDKGLRSNVCFPSKNFK